MVDFLYLCFMLVQCGRPHLLAFLLCLNNKVRPYAEMRKRKGGWFKKV